MEYFGGGADLAESFQPLLVEHNGNRLAFLGCNPVGPSFAWATETLPGAAPCDYERLYAEVARLRGEGYLPDLHLPVGGVLPLTTGGGPVGGISSRHRCRCPDCEREPGAPAPGDSSSTEEALIHYGPGNLFFDQMWVESPDDRSSSTAMSSTMAVTSSTELLTAILEDRAQPRPMTPEERAAFLEAMFTVSGS